ncbi:MAG: phytanoyl-CoA dioxygenase family protein [Pseudomonadota bacterium]
MTPDSFWITPDANSIDAFDQQISQQTQAADYPLATTIDQNVPIYDGDALRGAARDGVQRRAWKTEIIKCLKSGPGVLVIKNGLNKPDVIDRATALFETMIDEQNAKGAAQGDHFAKPGSNDRVWNALEKHCMADPENFAAYYACDGIALVSEAWLGLGYQITAQVNRVNPGGTAQMAHRDYHLGFMATDHVAEFPAHIHAMSPQLTLQGAVVHRDMPSASGPTMILPFSQSAQDGYVAFSRPEFQDMFNERRVQIAMQQGDLLFFSPALMHAAGANTTQDLWRFGNLLQVSSGFGRAMETIDRTAMSLKLYPVLQAAGFDAHDRAMVIAASAEGYPFPTNLDRDPPVGGMAPKSQAVQMTECLDKAISASEFTLMMQSYDARRQS